MDILSIRKYPSLEEVAIKLAPLQEEINSKRDQVIIAVSHGYDLAPGCGFNGYSAKHSIQAGLIGKDTRLPLSKEDEHGNEFLVDVEIIVHYLFIIEGGNLIIDGNEI